MTAPFAPDFTEGNYVSEQFDLPEDREEIDSKLKTSIEEIAKMVNRKDTGQYEEYEIQTNQTWPSDTPQEKRDIFRKIIDTGTLPNAGTITTAHGITGIDNNWFLTRIDGTAQEPAGAGLRPFYIPIPNAGAIYPVEIMVDTTNINITTTVNLSAFTKSYVVLEFYKA